MNPLRVVAAVAVLIAALTQTALAQSPTITGISPNTGTTAGGTIVTITGTGLSGALSVTFDGVAASFTVSGGSITANTPAHAAGAVDVTVALPGVPVTLVNGFTYTVTTTAPSDSSKLRALQIAGARIVAQNSGAAISGAVNAAIADGFGAGGQIVTPNSGGLHVNFAAEPGDDSNAARIDSAFAAVDRRQTLPLKAVAKPAEPKRWMLWADTRGSGIDSWGSASALIYGSQVNALAGLTYLVTPDLLIGGFGGYESFNYRSTPLNGRLTGDGRTVGSYIGWRFAEGLYLNVSGAYTDLDYDGRAGIATGRFGGARWMASGELAGNTDIHGFTIEPSAGLYALWERESAYVDSLGTSQDERNFFTGRASTGVKVTTPWATGDNIALAPYGGLYADYYFTGDDAAQIAGPPSPAILEGWSARVVGGIAARFRNGASVSLGGELGGIGTDVRIWTVQARASLPF